MDVRGEVCLGPLIKVTEVLGHSRITTTAEVYGHVTLEVQREATDWVAETLFQGA